MNLKSGIFWILFILIISPFMAYGLVQFVPGFGGFMVISGSMEPEISTGSLLFTRAVSADNVEVGDTITFQTGETHTTHKVIQKNVTNGEPSFVTQGVANEEPDPGTVTEDQIIGKKLISIPAAGYVISWAGTSTGLLLLVILPGSLLILMEFRNIYREFKKNQAS